jgi:hypothetical protein
MTGVRESRSRKTATGLAPRKLDHHIPIYLSEEGDMSHRIPRCDNGYDDPVVVRAGRARSLLNWTYMDWAMHAERIKARASCHKTQYSAAQYRLISTILSHLINSCINNLTK